MAGSFHELVIEAPYTMVKAFLTGFCIDQAKPGKLYFSRDVDIERKTLADRLRELFDGHGSLTHVIVEDSLLEPVRQAVESAREELGFEMVSQREIKEGGFEFSFQAFARTYAREIREVLDTVPPGVRLEGYSPEEKINPDAAGVEAYAPAHDYSCCGEGRATGSLDGVIDLHIRLTALSLVKAGTIELDLI